MQFSNQTLDLCMKAHNSKERGKEQAENTETVTLGSYLKVNLCKKEKCLFFSKDHVYIKHKESSVLGGMVPETRSPDSWPAGTQNFYQLKVCLNKNKSGKDHQA